MLPLLKPVIKECNLKKFRGQTCVIDIMGWLYRGAFSGASNLGTGGSVNTLSYMNFPFKMLKLLLGFDIKPICIFDGRPHEGKVEVEKKRSKDKAKNKSLANDAKKSGNLDEAKKFNQRCLFIKQK